MAPQIPYPHLARLVDQGRQLDDGYTESDVAELLRDLLAEADGDTLELSATPTVFNRRGLIWGASGVVVTFEDGSVFELTVQRRMGPRRT